MRVRINGEEFKVDVKGRERLIDLLRRLGMKSVKEGCSVGDCGSCNVIVNGKLVNSCRMLGVQPRESEIKRARGWGPKKKLHPLQRPSWSSPLRNAATVFREFL